MRKGRGPRRSGTRAGQRTGRLPPASAGGSAAELVDGAGAIAIASSEDAAAAGLRYVNDDEPGIARRRAGTGWSYRGPDGAVVRDRATLARIRSLAIPPAWTAVWICRTEDGHIQATGRDARGRKQYRYHRLWRERRDAGKFSRVLEFADALDRIRARVDEDLGRPGLPREKVLAAIVRLLEMTLIRVGNDEYARLNRSFGLSTLRDRHARVEGSSVRFRFRGKAGVVHDVGLRDRRLATIVRRCRDLPGQELFQYVGDDGVALDVHSDDVNAYIRDASGGPFSAKDFRTWAGTVLAFRALRTMDRPAGVTAAKRSVVAAVKETAEQLGNTPAVARSAYVHPAVLEAYLDEGLRDVILRAVDLAGPPGSPPQPEEEKAVASLLRERLERDARRVRDRAARRRRTRAAAGGREPLKPRRKPNAARTVTPGPHPVVA